MSTDHAELKLYIEIAKGS